MKIELQRLVDGIWYIYGNYDMCKTHDATAFGEAVSELAKHFNIRTVVSYTDVEKQVEGVENKIADVKANCDLAIEGRDLKIKELEKDLNYQKQARTIAENAVVELEKENKELKSELTKKADTNHSLVEQMAKLESNFRICEKNADTYYDQLTKARCTLNKIIETVCNDRIDEYGARLVLINDFAYKCLQEIEK